MENNKTFYCEHLSPKYIDEIESFTSKNDGKGLELYLKKQSLLDEKENLMRTYIVRNNRDGEIVGYFSLKAGQLSIQGRFNRLNMAIPGIEIANFSMNNSFIEKHSEIKGSGIVIFKNLIMPKIETISKEIGAQIVYIYSLPEEKVINNYHKYGFMRLPKKQERQLHRRYKPRYDKSCIFMYLKI